MGCGVCFEIMVIFKLRAHFNSQNINSDFVDIYNDGDDGSDNTNHISNTDNPLVIRQTEEQQGYQIFYIKPHPRHQSELHCCA